eukprot:TRINITY_DN16066_c0_g1_i1.p1 TRINITY_DN16066_c0_g1~~TRINITY_DN16066_c0_g1_i1.p1  ORF type:complete len:2287 (+),score=373.46 TRINITY_DN16066_c0_g1_i1:79-6939(+)
MPAPVPALEMLSQHLEQRLPSHVQISEEPRISLGGRHVNVRFSFRVQQDKGSNPTSPGGQRSRFDDEDEEHQASQAHFRSSPVSTDSLLPGARQRSCSATAGTSPPQNEEGSVSSRFNDEGYDVAVEVRQASGRRSGCPRIERAASAQPVDVRSSRGGAEENRRVGNVEPAGKRQLQNAMESFDGEVDSEALQQSGFPSRTRPELGTRSDERDEEAISSSISLRNADAAGRRSKEDDDGAGETDKGVRRGFGLSAKRSSRARVSFADAPSRGLPAAHVDGGKTVACDKHHGAESDGVVRGRKRSSIVSHGLKKDGTDSSTAFGKVLGHQDVSSVDAIDARSGKAADFASDASGSQVLGGCGAMPTCSGSGVAVSIRETRRCVQQGSVARLHTRVDEIAGKAVIRKSMTTCRSSTALLEDVSSDREGLDESARVGKRSSAPKCASLVDVEGSFTQEASREANRRCLGTRKEDAAADDDQMSKTFGSRLQRCVERSESNESSDSVLAPCTGGEARISSCSKQQSDSVRVKSHVRCAEASRLSIEGALACGLSDSETAKSAASDIEPALDTRESLPWSPRNLSASRGEDRCLASTGRASAHLVEKQVRGSRVRGTNHDAGNVPHIEKDGTSRDSMSNAHVCGRDRADSRVTNRGAGDKRATKGSNSGCRPQDGAASARGQGEALTSDRKSKRAVAYVNDNIHAQDSASSERGMDHERSETCDTDKHVEARISKHARHASRLASTTDAASSCASVSVESVRDTRVETAITTHADRKEAYTNMFDIDDASARRSDCSASNKRGNSLGLQSGLRAVDALEVGRGSREQHTHSACSGKRGMSLESERRSVDDRARIGGARNIHSKAEQLQTRGRASESRHSAPTSGRAKSMEALSFDPDSVEEEGSDACDRMKFSRRDSERRNCGSVCRANVIAGEGSGRCCQTDGRTYTSNAKHSAVTRSSRLVDCDDDEASYLAPNDEVHESNAASIGGGTAASPRDSVTDRACQSVTVPREAGRLGSQTCEHGASKANRDPSSFRKSIHLDSEVIQHSTTRKSARSRNEVVRASAHGSRGRHCANDLIDEEANSGETGEDVCSRISTAITKARSNADICAVDQFQQLSEKADFDGEAYEEGECVGFSATRVRSAACAELVSTARSRQRSESYESVNEARASSIGLVSGSVDTASLANEYIVRDGSAQNRLHESANSEHAARGDEEGSARDASLQVQESSVRSEDCNVNSRRRSKKKQNDAHRGASRDCDTRSESTTSATDLLRRQSERSHGKPCNSSRIGMGVRKRSDTRVASSDDASGRKETREDCISEDASSANMRCQHFTRQLAVATQSTVVGEVNPVCCDNDGRNTDSVKVRSDVDSNGDALSQASEVRINAISRAHMVLQAFAAASQSLGVGARESTIEEDEEEESSRSITRESDFQHHDGISQDSEKQRVHDDHAHVDSGCEERFDQKRIDRNLYEGRPSEVAHQSVRDTGRSCVETKGRQNSAVRASGYSRTSLDGDALLAHLGDNTSDKRGEIAPKVCTGGNAVVRSTGSREKGVAGDLESGSSQQTSQGNAESSLEEAMPASGGLYNSVLPKLLGAETYGSPNCTKRSSGKQVKAVPAAKGSASRGDSSVVSPGKQVSGDGRSRRDTRGASPCAHTTMRPSRNGDDSRALRSQLNDPVLCEEQAIEVTTSFQESGGREYDRRLADAARQCRQACSMMDALPSHYRRAACRYGRRDQPEFVGLAVAPSSIEETIDFGPVVELDGAERSKMLLLLEQSSRAVDALLGACHNVEDAAAASVALPRHFLKLCDSFEVNLHVLSDGTEQKPLALDGVPVSLAILTRIVEVLDHLVGEDDRDICRSFITGGASSLTVGAAPCDSVARTLSEALSPNGFLPLCLQILGGEIRIPIAVEQELSLHAVIAVRLLVAWIPPLSAPRPRAQLVSFGGHGALVAAAMDVLKPLLDEDFPGHESAEPQRPETSLLSTRLANLALILDSLRVCTGCEEFASRLKRRSADAGCQLAATPATLVALSVEALEKIADLAHDVSGSCSSGGVLGVALDAAATAAVWLLAVGAALPVATPLGGATPQHCADALRRVLEIRPLTVRFAVAIRALVCGHSPSAGRGGAWFRSWAEPNSAFAIDLQRELAAEHVAHHCVIAVRRALDVAHESHEESNFDDGTSSVGASHAAGHGIEAVAAGAAQHLSNFGTLYGHVEAIVRALDCADEHGRGGDAAAELAKLMPEDSAPEMLASADFNDGVVVQEARRRGALDSALRSLRRSIRLTCLAPFRR